MLGADVVWYVWFGILALYVIVIAAILWRSRRLRREVATMRSWPSVAGRVVESRIDETSSVKGGTTYFPMVVYDYTVEGRALRGTRMYAGDVVGHSVRRRAERRLAALAAAAAVQVYYDPADPTVAVIERRAPVLRRNGVLLAILVVILAGVLTFPLWL